MASRTITVTIEAYEALKAAKETSESFSEAIIRVVKKRSPREFFGSISSETADGMERAIAARRAKHAVERKKRIRKIVDELGAG